MNRLDDKASAGLRPDARNAIEAIARMFAGVADETDDTRHLRQLEIRCARCGVTKRVPADKGDRQPRCGRCKTRLSASVG